MKNIWKIMRLTFDPKLNMYTNGFMKTKNPEKELYFKTMYKVRYDEIVKKLNRKGWYFISLLCLIREFYKAFNEENKMTSSIGRTGV